MSNTLYLGNQVQIKSDNNVLFGSSAVDMTAATLSVATPVAPSNAVTKAYVDSQVSNLLSNVSPSALDSFTEVVSAFQTADSNLNGAITALAASASSNLATESARAGAAELVLTNDLSAEVSRAGAAELVLTNDLSAEVSRAGAAELVLTNDLSAEVSRAGAAELVLTNDLSAEVSRAGAAEDALTARINAMCVYFFKNAAQF